MGAQTLPPREICPACKSTNVGTIVKAHPAQNFNRCRVCRFRWVHVLEDSAPGPVPGLIVEETDMSKRFHRGRWSKTRLAMDAMKPGERLDFPLDQYSNAHVSAKALGDAYEGRRKWMATRCGNFVVVTMEGSK